MITIGLDFGTHQTKVCIENKQGVELNYSFLKFNDNKGGLNYTLPSIIISMRMATCRMDIYLMADRKSVV